MFRRLEEVRRELDRVANGEYGERLWRCFGPNVFGRPVDYLKRKAGARVPRAICQRVYVHGERLAREILREAPRITGLDLAVLGIIHRERLREWRTWARFMIEARRVGNKEAFLRTVRLACRPPGVEFSVDRVGPTTELVEERALELWRRL